MKEDNNQKVDNPEGLYPSSLAGKADDGLRQYMEAYRDAPHELVDPMRYCLLGGGKRLRPVLCMASAISLGYEPEYVMPTACAIEFIHSYSLVHDDLPAIDDDDLRRGQPSCHKRYGEAIAILAGDALFAESFNIMLKHQEGSPGCRLKAVMEIADAAGARGMVAGQVIDINSTASSISRELLQYMHISKTARLISASVVAAALLCGAGEDIIKGLREYGINTGLAFQITDDIIDITSSSDITGKTRGKDKKQEKNTYPSIWGIDGSRKIAREKVDRALEAVDRIPVDPGLLKDIARFILIRRA